MFAVGERMPPRSANAPCAGDRRTGRSADLFGDRHLVVGASLFAAFPVVYAGFLPAFYIPVLLLLFGLAIG